eukprot:SAG25_NODE_47_length_18954_cov_11.266295_2_plen_85_part_00
MAALGQIAEVKRELVAADDARGGGATSTLESMDAPAVAAWMRGHIHSEEVAQAVERERVDGLVLLELMAEGGGAGQVAGSDWRR